jgi:N6-L-threonylcarbamoyladenine synthase
MALVLGIESSCDDTGVALVHGEADGQMILCAQTLHSQASMHALYGGVVPELASRDHIRYLLPLIKEAMTQTDVDLSAVDVIAYTQGPGLAGALLVGSTVANALAFALNKPSAGIHHLEGHLLSPFLSQDPPSFPFLALLVSGGHTQLMAVQDVGQYVLLGQTVDDAAGEAFDKTAKLLGLGYPGGAALAALAEKGDPQAFKLPRPLMHRDELNFSFAGLKTAVLTTIQKGAVASPQARADLAASTQQAIVDVLVHKTLQAAAQTQLPRVVVAGGVGANWLLRRTLSQQLVEKGIPVHYPELALCSDNGAMIALAAAMRHVRGCLTINTQWNLDIKPRWALGANEGV